MKNYLCIDMGGTQIKYGLLNENGEIIYKDFIPSRTESFDQLTEDLYKLKDLIKDEYEAVFVSMPGRIDSKKGIAYTGGSFEFIKNDNFADRLKNIFNKDVVIANDAKCAASAELWGGSLKDYDNSQALILGTALGSGLIFNHQIYNGSTLSAGEISAFITNFNLGFDFPFNDFAFLKVSTSALIETYSSLKNIDKSEVNGIMIFDNYENGEEGAIKAVETLATNTALLIYTLQSVNDLQAYAIGGGISKRESLIEAINKKVDEIFLKFSFLPINKPDVVKCRFCNDANLIGALFYGLHN